MEKPFQPPPRKINAEQIGTKQVGRDGRTWEAVESSNGVVRWVPQGRLARRLYVNQQSAQNRKPRKAGVAKSSRPVPGLEWIKEHPSHLKMLVAGESLKIASDRQALEKQVRIFRDGWGAITTRNQDLSDERISEESNRALKKIIQGYVDPESTAILAQWLAPLLIKALR